MVKALIHKRGNKCSRSLIRSSVLQRLQQFVFLQFDFIGQCLSPFFKIIKRNFWSLSNFQSRTDPSPVLCRVLCCKMQHAHLFLYFGVIVSLLQILRQIVGSQCIPVYNTKHNCCLNALQSQGMLLPEEGGICISSLTHTTRERYVAFQVWFCNSILFCWLVSLM